MNVLLLSILTYFPFLTFVLGQQNQSDSFVFSAQISALKAKSAAHEKEIAELLSSSDLQPTIFKVPTPGGILIPSPAGSTINVPPAPYLPVPDYYKVKESPDPKEENENLIIKNEYPDPEFSAPTDGLDLNSSFKQSDIGEENDSSKKVIPERQDGYYFGPLLGFVLPDNGAVRDLNQGKIPYESDAGYFLGIQCGKDFGSLCWEVEYSHQGFDAQGDANDFEIGVHEFATRLLLEKEIGDLIDLRAGLGMGIGFISIESDEEYSGESFVYDFAIGASYRLRDNMNLSLDYRYFLSAAEDRYDRLKSHIFTASANFDL